MADTKISNLTEATTIVATDEFPVVTDPGTTPVTKRTLFSTLRTFLATALHADTSKASVVNGDEFAILDSAASFVQKKAAISVLPTYIVNAFHNATGKTTPVDNDEMLLMDSAASYGRKKLLWSDLKATLLSSWGTMIDSLTAKTTPVDGDEVSLADSAASFATKKLSWANIKTTLFGGALTLGGKLTVSTGGIDITDGNIRSRSGNLNDDTVVSFTPSRTPGGILIQTSNANGFGWARCVTGTPATTGLLLGSATVVTTGILTDGTTDGTDAKLNISCHTDGKIYIKNRLGGAIGYEITLI